MQKLYKIILSIIFVLCICYIGNSQNIFYVSTTGSNSNDGTSLGQPWKTIQYAMDNATANSIVNITTGTYNEKVEVNVSGSVNNTIVFKNYGNDMVTISGAGINNPEAVIGIIDQSYITIQGLYITDNEQLDAQGIVVEGNCQNIEIRNNDISKINFSSNASAPVNSSTNSQPIIVYGTDGNNAITNLVIADNIVHNSRTGFSEGLAINGNVNGFEVTNNIVRDITNIGIDIIGHEGTANTNDQAHNGIIKGNTVYNCKSPYATAGGIYVDGGKDLLIENNRVYQCQWGIEIGCENVGKTTSGIKVRNNFIYGNDDAGIAIGGYDYPSNSGKVVDCEIRNNSCYNNDTNDAGVGGVTGEINITYTENCVLENNIFYATNTADIVLFVEDVNSINLALNYNQFYIVGSAEFEYEGTVYSIFSSYQNGASQDANSIFSNPEFKDISVADHHLTSSSPGLDAGNPAFMADIGETDIDGDNRVINSRVDIGADEYSMTTSAHIITSSLDISIYPNPFADKVIIDGDFDNYQIKILNNAGAIITNYTGTSSPLTIDLSALGAGLYFILIQNTVHTKASLCKILKQ
ncbi:MAG: T9SS type A sorting domain-containing protein [Saprospiraceae bacterium]